MHVFLYFSLNSQSFQEGLSARVSYQTLLTYINFYGVLASEDRQEAWQASPKVVIRLEDPQVSLAWGELVRGKDTISLQCIDIVCWTTSRASGP